MAVTTEDQKPNAVGSFFREAFTEMRKVVWPSGDETRRLTMVVLGVSLSIGFFLAAFDFLFTELVRLFQ